MIDKPGIYTIRESEYHADPVIEPSLSRSIIKELVELSPAHAYAAHPRLGGSSDVHADDGTEAQDVGTAAHSMFLQGEQIARLCDFPDWRTNKAKDARAAAILDGKIPLKRATYDRAMRLVEKLCDFRDETGAFTEGKPEQTVVWQEGTTWCRARADWLCDNGELWDLKTTSGRAISAVWARQAFDFGADIQASFYARGVEAVLGDQPPHEMRFCVIETRPPFAIKVFELSPVAMEVGSAKVNVGLSTWEQCRATNTWPSYSLEPEYIDAPTWMIRAWEWMLAGSRAAEQVREREAATSRIISAGSWGG